MAVFAFVYDNLMRGSISRFKYHGRQEYAEYYADVMYKQYYEWIKRVAPDALIPVPITRSVTAKGDLIKQNW